MWIVTFFKQIRDSLTPNTPSPLSPSPSLNLTPFTPCPLFPLSKLERGLGGEAITQRGTGGEVVAVRQRKKKKRGALS